MVDYTRISESRRIQFTEVCRDHFPESEADDDLAGQDSLVDQRLAKFSIRGKGNYWTAGKIPWVSWNSTIEANHDKKLTRSWILLVMAYTFSSSSSILRLSFHSQSEQSPKRLTTFSFFLVEVPVSTNSLARSLQIGSFFAHLLALKTRHIFHNSR